MVVLYLRHGLATNRFLIHFFPVRQYIVTDAKKTK